MKAVEARVKEGREFMSTSPTGVGVLFLHDVDSLLELEDPNIVSYRDGSRGAVGPEPEAEGGTKTAGSADVVPGRVEVLDRVSSVGLVGCAVLLE